MRALYFDGDSLAEKKARKPRRRRGEVRIRVSLAGICSTDLEIMKGYMGFTGIPGHEFVGTIESSDDPGLAGKRVTGSINIPCGRCPDCLGGLGKHCAGREVLGIAGRNGAFAEYLVLPRANIHLVPDSVSDEKAVFTELLAAACEIPERVPIGRGDRVAVIGDGRLAAMCGQVIRPRAGKLTVIGVHSGKLAALEGAGLDTIDIGEASPPAASFDIAVDCTGSPGGLTEAARLVRPRGTVVIKSTFHGKGGWNPTAAVVNELTIVGSRCGPLDAALRLIEKGEVEVLPFLTAAYPFEKWRSAFRRASRRDSFKVALRF